MSNLIRCNSFGDIAYVDDLSPKQMPVMLLNVEMGTCNVTSTVPEFFS